MATKGVTELTPFERCRSCSAELSPDREICPACGTRLPRSPSDRPAKWRWSTGRKISHAIIALLLVVVANLYRPYVEPYLRLMWPLWLAPYVGEAMSRIEANKTAIAFLGAPVSHSLFVRGRLRNYDGESGVAQFRVAVSGTKGRGMLQAALGKVDGTWVFAQLRLILDGSGKVVDLLDGSDQPGRAALDTDRTVYLVPLGEIDQDAVGLPELPEFYHEKFNLQVKLLPPLAIEEKARDRKRQQLIAEYWSTSCCVACRTWPRIPRRCSSELPVRTCIIAGVIGILHTTSGGTSRVWYRAIDSMRNRPRWRQDNGCNPEFARLPAG